MKHSGKKAGKAATPKPLNLEKAIAEHKKFRKEIKADLTRVAYIEDPPALFIHRNRSTWLRSSWGDFYHVPIGTAIQWYRDALNYCGSVQLERPDLLLDAVRLELPYKPLPKK